MINESGKGQGSFENPIEKRKSYIDRLIVSGVINTPDEAEALIPFLEQADKNFGKVVSPNIYEAGYSSPKFLQVAKKALEVKKGALEYHKIPGFDKIEQSFRNLLVSENLERSIKELKPFPQEDFPVYNSPSEVFKHTNNFFARFDGRSPREFLTPALLRLMYLQPDLVRRLSRVVTNRNDF